MVGFALQVRVVKRERGDGLRTGENLRWVLGFVVKRLKIWVFGGEGFGILENEFSENVSAIFVWIEGKFPGFCNAGRYSLAPNHYNFI